MKIGENNELLLSAGGDIVKDNEIYVLTDNTVLKNLAVSTTNLHPYKMTRGHKHEGQEEVYIFTSGKGVMYLDLEEFPVQKGDVVVIEDGQFHRVENPNNEPLKFLRVFQGKRNH